MLRRWALGLVVAGLAGICPGGERCACSAELSLVADPEGLAQVAGKPSELSHLMQNAAKEGFRRVMVSPLALRAGIARPGDAAEAKEALAAAEAEGLRAWSLLPMFGGLRKLPPELLSAARDGGAPLRGVPCYGLSETRAALLAEARRYLDLPGEGIFLLLDGPVVWAAGNAAAREYGYNAPVVEEFKRRYGSDPREAKADSLEQMFLLRLKGEHLAAAIREVAAGAHKMGKKMGLALALSETNVRTAVHAYVDVEGLIRDRTLDEVALLGGQQFNCLRWKVQADPPPAISIWVSVPAEGNGLRTAIGMGLKNATVDGIVLDALPAFAAGRWGDVGAAVQALEAQRRDRERFEAALAAGEFQVVAGVREPQEGDQATTHGVAQSFMLDKAAGVVAVRLFLALRAAPDAEVADLPVELRADQEGKPSGEVMAAGEISPCALSADPMYTWAVVRFPTAVGLEAGRTYWIHVPDTKGYVWRMDPKASYPDGNAWSRQYDYTKGDWVFEVLAGRER